MKSENEIFNEIKLLEREKGSIPAYKPRARVLVQVKIDTLKWTLQNFRSSVTMLQKRC